MESSIDVVRAVPNELGQAHRPQGRSTGRQRPPGPGLHAGVDRSGVGMEAVLPLARPGQDGRPTLEDLRIGRLAAQLIGKLTTADVLAEADECRSVNGLRGPGPRGPRNRWGRAIAQR